MPILYIRGLPNGYLDGRREVNQELTNAIIWNTCTKKQSTETLLNAESWDAEMCKCNVHSSFPRAEVRFYHSEYDYLLERVRVRHG
jgi:hypothetical protein